MPGSYKVEVRLGARAGEAHATVLPRETVGIHVPLESRLPVHVETEPPGATLSLDGYERGTSPLDLAVTGDPPHRLKASLRDYQAEELSLGDDQPSAQLTLEPARWQIVWSILFPQFEVDRRLGERVWGGLRLQGLGPGVAPFACYGNVLAGQFVSAAALLHQRLEAPGAYWGFELFGGPTVEALDYRPTVSASGSTYPRCSETTNAFFGAVLGAGVRAGPFEFLFEVHGGVAGRDVVVYELPSFALRHTF